GDGGRGGVGSGGGDGGEWGVVSGRRRFGRVVADSKYPEMWRSTLSGGRLSDKANLAWAKNAGRAAAEREPEWEARQRAAIAPSKSPGSRGGFRGSARGCAHATARRAARSAPRSTENNCPRTCHEAHASRVSDSAGSV